MADHKIGIGVEVKQNNGVDMLRRNFEQIDKTVENLHTEFQQLNKSTTSLLQRGWGSEKYTGELREQLRLMQTMANLADRQARSVGNTEAVKQAQKLSSDIKDALKDVGAVRTSGGGIFDKTADFSKWAASGIGSFVAFKGVQSILNGYNQAQQQLAMQASIAKTMAPNGGTLSWANQMLGSGQGYGYTNQDILPGAQTIKSATGYSKNFFDQINSVAQFGRRYGFDYGQAAQYFAGSYQSGVTGGSAQQMSWQQYAILVANTVQAGNMKGRESQLIESLQQLTSIAQQSMVNAPNQQGVAGLYATAAKTGNQAFLNQFPQIMGAVNNGMMSPGMGPMGQAAMWQAVAPGMNYWQAQYQMSLGAFGTGTNGNTNFQNMMQYAYKQFGGNNDQSAVMMAQWLGISPAQAKMLMSTYMKNGQFQSTQFNQAKQKLGPSMSPIDLLNQQFVNAQQQQQNAGSMGLGPMGWLNSILFGSPTSTMLTGGISAISTYALGQKFLKGIFGGPMSEMATNGSKVGRIAGATGRVLEGAGSGLWKALRVGGTDLLGALALPMDFQQAQKDKEEAQQQYEKNKVYINRMNRWYKQHPQSAWDTLMKFQPQATDPTAPWNIQANQGYQYKSSSAAVDSQRQRVDPQKNARDVVATMVALKPMMGQLRALMGTDGPYVTNAAMSSGAQPAPLSAGLIAKLQTAGQSGDYSSVYSLPTSGSYGVPTSTSKQFVNKMKPYALETARSLGVPQQYQDTVAQYLLGQWGEESSWGASGAAHSNLNFGGIKPPGSGHGPGADSTYAGYSSLDDWANGYAYFLKNNKRYQGVLQAMQNGASPAQIAALMGQTGYAEDPNYSSKIYGAYQSVTGSYASAPSTPQTVKIQAAPVKLVITNESGKVVGSSLVQFTQVASMTGQAAAGFGGGTRPPLYSVR